MDTIWIFAGFTLFLIAFIVIHAMMKKASDERHEETMLNPLSDVFVTQAGQEFRLKRKRGEKPELRHIS